MACNYGQVVFGRRDNVPSSNPLSLNEPKERQNRDGNGDNLYKGSTKTPCQGGNRRGTAQW